MRRRSGPAQHKRAPISSPPCVSDHLRATSLRRVLDAYAPVVGLSPVVDQRLAALRDVVAEELKVCAVALPLLFKGSVSVCVFDALHGMFYFFSWFQDDVCFFPLPSRVLWLDHAGRLGYACCCLFSMTAVYHRAPDSRRPYRLFSLQLFFQKHPLACACSAPFKHACCQVLPLCHICSARHPCKPYPAVVPTLLPTLLYLHCPTQTCSSLMEVQGMLEPLLAASLSASLGL